jgi:hypothetical protein
MIRQRPGPEEEQPESRRQEERKKSRRRDLNFEFEEDAAEEDDTFTPADSAHFQNAADTPASCGAPYCFVASIEPRYGHDDRHPESEYSL